MRDVQIHIESTATPENDNIEVEVTLPSGDRYWATFITLKNIDSLFEKNERTGEHACGTYFPVSSNMIIVRTLAHEIIERTIEDLFQSREFDATFQKLYPYRQMSPNSVETAYPVF